MSESLVIPDICPILELIRLFFVIDWVTAVLPCRHFPIDNGVVTKVDSSGEIEWLTRCRKQLEGSYSSKISVRSDGTLDELGRASHLFVSGNPSKFLQGHNIFGSDELVTLMREAYFCIVRLLELEPTPEDISLVTSGEYSLSRVDINYSYSLNSRADVLAWLRAVELTSKTRSGRAMMKGSTLYWQPASTRWSMKAYSKGDEIEARNHKLPIELQETLLPAWANDKLRVELTLKTKELKRQGIQCARDLTAKRANELYFEYLGKIEMAKQLKLSDSKERELPSSLRGTYVMWRDGYDLRGVLPKTTFYRHRKAFLEHGINIAVRHHEREISNVVPFIRILEAVPASIPDWAFEQGLVHGSAARALA